MSSLLFWGYGILLLLLYASILSVSVTVQTSTFSSSQSPPGGIMTVGTFHLSEAFDRL